MRLFAENVHTAARARDITIFIEEASNSGALAPAFDRLAERGVQAAIVPVNGLFFSQSTQIAQLALATRLPTVAADRPYVEAGWTAWRRP
jgi:ABC-type uncharacterized transport system substrate-binding protein